MNARPRITSTVIRSILIDSGRHEACGKGSYANIFCVALRCNRMRVQGKKIARGAMIFILPERIRE